MKCTTIGCNNKLMAKGMCSKCYYRVKRGGTPYLSKKQQQALRTCEIKGCDKPHASRGMCQTHYMQWRRENLPGLRQKDRKWTTRWKRKNPEKLAKQLASYRQRHKKRLDEYYIAWRTKNIDSFLAYQASRKRRVKKATPKWADLDKIKDFYLNCPTGYHVDHIVPINGQIVCGLHTHENLQYLLARQNLSKSNKFE